MVSGRAGARLCLEGIGEVGMSAHAPRWATARCLVVGVGLAGGALAPARAAAQGAHRPRATTEAAAPVITLERTACRGQCAEYRLSFFDDGQVIYEGKANVSKAGRWHAVVPKQMVADLVADFQRIGFLSLDRTYPPGLTETSTATTTLRVGDRVKTVTHDVGSPFPPPALATLEDRIDAAVQQANWVR
jgi:uncharacterized protein DUF6438